MAQALAAPLGSIAIDACSCIDGSNQVALKDSFLPKTCRHAVDKTGADLLFQIISHRYERGATIITSNRVYKKWPEIFNNDSTLTSARRDLDGTLEVKIPCEAISR